MTTVQIVHENSLYASEEENTSEDNFFSTPVSEILAKLDITDRHCVIF